MTPAPTVRVELDATINGDTFRIGTIELGSNNGWRNELADGLRYAADRIERHPTETDGDTP